MFATLLGASLLTSLAGNPPLRGDAIAPFQMLEPEGGVYAWEPGRVTVLCAFAYWCDTWKTQRVRLMEARRKLSGLPVDFLAVSVDGKWLEVDRKADWSRRLVDVGSRWSTGKGIDRIPYTLIIDASGTVQWASYGISRSDDILREVRNARTNVVQESTTVYVSFDDFPAKKGNAELLDALRQSDVKASLFVIGENAKADPKWLKRAVDDGHHLEVHGWRHTAQGSEPEYCRDWITQQTGRKPNWLRGPGSSVIQDFSGNAFITSVVDPYDFLRPGEPELKRRIIGRLKGGSTLHLHAGVPETVAALPEIFERGRKLGLHFQPLP